MKILVADDDKISRNILTAMLKKSGHEVMSVDDGSKAMEIIDLPDPPQILILDWMMPEMNGIDVCKEVRKKDTIIKPYIIMLTALDKKEHVVMGLSSGADDYIAKPFDEGELKARIDVGERIVAMQLRLVNDANTDTLTGLPNRSLINFTIERELARISREGGLLGIAMLDLDYFKKINDAYGHKAGDEVLILFAHRCKKVLRSYDSMGRYGGEEFIVVASKKYETNQPWQRLLEAVNSSEFETKSGLIKVTVSIGVAYSRADFSLEEIIHNADKALYKAKSNGRNRVEYHDASNISRYTDLIGDLENKA